MQSSEKYDIGNIYERQVDTVYRVCLSYAKTKADTEDCVSDTFVKLLRARPRFKDIEHEKAWLIRVAINVCKDYLKRPSVLMYEDLGDLAAESPDSFERSDVLDAVRNLPEELRAVLYLYFYEGYKFHEIAEIVGVSESTVRRHMDKAKGLLKSALGGVLL
ncbi:MAG: sigma-70 family RNA polymerase sigma factor [Oscillospiraceae bacterium]|nr:sigma-70 family RNA polymerase sigma factor [Oscillospiraceae bacterium]